MCILGPNTWALLSARLPKKPAPEESFVTTCDVCGATLAGPAEVGWECECGVRVCRERDCFDERFKLVAGGEATRCLTCGLVT